MPWKLTDNGSDFGEIGAGVWTRSFAFFPPVFAVGVVISSSLVIVRTVQET